MVNSFELAIFILGFGLSYSLNYIGEYQAAYTVPTETRCNCTLDSLRNRAGFELPKVEVLQSPTEQPLEWTESKEIGMDGILVGNTYLGNYSAGDLVDLNTIYVKPNQLLGLEITDGTLPDIVSVEVLNSTTPLNNTEIRLGEIIVDKKIYDSFVLYNKSLETPSALENTFRLRLPSQGDFVLIVYLLYNYDSEIGNSNNDSGGTQTSSFVALYKSVLSVT